MELIDLTTLTGAAACVVLLLEVGKRAIRPSEDALDRFGALAAIGSGVALSSAATILTGGAEIPQAVLTGALAGLQAIGIYKVAS